MAKRSINLIIIKEEETPQIKRFKIILPGLAVCLLVVFLTAYFISLANIKINLNQFNLLKNEDSLLQVKIKNVKNTEGLYTSSVKLVNSIDKLLQSNKNLIDSFIPRIYNLKAENLNITDISIDKQGAVSFSVSADNSKTLEKFIASLTNNTENYHFANIQAHAIVRDKKGSYSLKITLNIIA